MNLIFNNFEIFLIFLRILKTWDDSGHFLVTQESL